MFEKALAALQRQEAGRLRSPYGAATPQFLPLTLQPRTLIFVDGGNAPLYESPEARIEYVRVAAVTYDGRERRAVDRREGAVTITHEGEQIRAVSDELAFDERFDATSDELRVGNDEVQLGTVANLCRFLIECRLAAEQEGLVIRDGTLQGLNTHEERALAELRDVAGLAKTTTLRTSSGMGATSAVLADAPAGAWCCTLDERSALVKLHARSAHVFRLDSSDALGVADALAVLADDAAFPGYPYGLIEADRLARIGHQEARTLRTRLQAEAGAAWPGLAAQERALDAHGILDALANRKHLK